MIRFNLPSLAELDRIGSKERLNLFRQYFSASRYNRLIIQQCLIKSAYDESFISKVKELEDLHNQDFIDKVRIVKDGSSHVVPIWFVLDDKNSKGGLGDIIFTTGSESIKAENIHRILEIVAPKALQKAIFGESA